MKRIASFLTLLLTTITLLAYNPDFVLKYNQAKALYDQGQYEKALSTIRNALKQLPDLSSDQVNEGNQLISLCNQAINNRDRLDLSTERLEVGYESRRDSIGFVAGKPNQVTVTSEAPGWCKVDKITNNRFYLTLEFNPDKVSRETDVVVKMGKTKKRTLHVVQAARPETTKWVSIKTVPDRARISVDGADPYTGTWQGTLPSGDHLIRIEKNGYAVKDTVLHVLDNLRSDETIVMDVRLQPQFAKIKIDVQPEKGFSFEPGALAVTMNGVAVDLTPRELYSYDDDRDIQRYSYYLDGTVPVSPGWVDIQISAPGFVPQKTQLEVKANTVVPLPITLNAVTGFLSAIDNGQAREAIVYLDGEKIGTVHNLTARRTMVGEHTLVLEREGYLPGEQSYTVVVKENEDAVVRVSMDRYTTIRVNSNPADARVMVDEEYIGTTPTKDYVLREQEPGHVFHVEVSADGFLPVTRDVVPDFANPEPIVEDFVLLSTHKLTISADEPNMMVTIKNRRRGDTTYVASTLLPADVSLPLRQKPYYVELYRVGESSAAYKGRLSFKDESKTEQRFRAWSKNYFQFLSANYFLTGIQPIELGNLETRKTYRNMGNASFAKFKLFDGLSTSLARGGLFMGTDLHAPLTVEKSNKEHTVGNEQFLPAISALFINGEFRVGATFFDYLDVSAMASYAWYPDVWKYLVGFSYMTGHDIFVGLEASTRLPIFNVNFKAGMQMYKKMEAQLFLNDMGNTGDLKNQFYSEPVTLPNMLVISVGFTLGGMNSKGTNMLRVWY